MLWICLFLPWLPICNQGHITTEYGTRIATQTGEQLRIDRTPVILTESGVKMLAQNEQPILAELTFGIITESGSELITETGQQLRIEFL